MRYRLAAALTVALSVVLGGLTMAPGIAPVASAHQASTNAPSTGLMPSAVPAAYTPSVDNGDVQSIAQVGNLIVIGGAFTSVGGQPRNHIAAFNATTGALSTTFLPSIDGTVYSVIPGPTAGTVFAGGDFSQVNGVAVKYLTLLNVNTGAAVSGFVTPVIAGGRVNDLVLRGTRLYLGGYFAKVAARAHVGLASLNATTGALDPFMNVQLAGHHNTVAGGARGNIGTIAFDASQDGTRMVVAGNFATANGLPREQLAMIDLDGSSAAVDTTWATTLYTPVCFYWAFDTYMRGITFSPDGSYFVVNATGGGNPGTLCDATVRFETHATGSDIQPTWIDETGGDTVWATAITDTAIFVGGHNRWENNPLGVDASRAGAVPRPGLEAFDPVSGRPLAWNPGRKPLGVAVFAMLATPQGLWIGSNTDWIGNYKYRRQKIAFFPYAGGQTVASTVTGSLPGTVYLGGSPSIQDSLQTVRFTGTSASPAQNVANGGIPWGSTHETFMVGNRVFYGASDGLHVATFDGTTWGTPTLVDPYHDPVWENVATGVGSTTFGGQFPDFYSQAPNVTGMVYSAGRVYYTLAGDSQLHWAWFSPDSGIIDQRLSVASSSVDFSSADGLFAYNGTLYYGSTDGYLRAVPFANGAVTGLPTPVSGPLLDGVDWRNHSMFLYQGPG